MAKVAICIPSPDMVHADFALCLGALAYSAGPVDYNGKKLDPIQLAFINVKGSSVANNRNKLVDLARNLGVDYLLFLDTDMIIPMNALRRLVAHDKDIVGATYIQREEPFMLLGKATDGRLLAEALNGVDIQGDLMEVGALPAGCLLIKLSVFDNMVKPYFRTPAHESDLDGTEWIEGEDYYFCRIARDRGYQVWVDWPLSFNMTHLGQSKNIIPTIQKEAEAENVIIH